MNERPEDMISPTIVFYSYAHEDELLRNELEKHLSLLRRQGLISEWHDRQILAGEEWVQEIDEYLEAASIILLLISPDFLASDYCYDIEMQHALERHQRGDARVIPIILRPCDWQTSPFARLQCLPRDGKPVTEWDNQDAAFRDIAKGIRNALTQKRNPSVRSSTYHQNHRRFHLQLFLSRRTHLAKPLVYTLIGLVLISVLTALRPLWYGAFFPSSVPTANQASRTRIPLEAPFVTGQSKYWAIPGDLSQYSPKNQPQEQVAVLHTDAHVSAPLYYIYLNFHNSSSAPSKLIIEEVDLVIQKVRPMPHPVHVWAGGPLIYDSTHKYEALYSGQESGAILADHVNVDYLTHHPGTFLLSPGETDTMEVHVVSRREADLVFSVQVIYHFGTEQQHYTFRLSNIFEIMFVDTSDWQLYQFKDGHFI